MDDSLLIFGVLTNQVLFIRGEVNNLNIGGYVIENLVLLEEGAVDLGEVIELNGVEVHLGTGHQEGEILLVGGHDGVLDEQRVVRLEVLLPLAELLVLLLLVVHVVVHQH